MCAVLLVVLLSMSAVKARDARHTGRRHEQHALTTLCTQVQDTYGSGVQYSTVTPSVCCVKYVKAALQTTTHTPGVT